MPVADIDEPLTEAAAPLPSRVQWTALELSEFQAVLRLGYPMALIPETDTAILGSMEALGLAEAENIETWHVGLLEGLDLRGRPPRLAVKRDAEGGALIYVAVRHYWRVETRGQPGRLPGDHPQVPSCEPAPHDGQQVVLATDAPT